MAGTSWPERASVEDFPQPGPLPAMMAVRVVVVVVTSGVTAVTLGRNGASGRHGRGRQGPFKDLVQFTTIQPDTAALRAIVNFDALPIRHDQVNFNTSGTFHRELNLPTNYIQGFKAQYFRPGHQAKGGEPDSRRIRPAKRAPAAGAPRASRIARSASAPAGGAPAGGNSIVLLRATRSNRSAGSAGSGSDELWGEPTRREYHAHGPRYNSRSKVCDPCRSDTRRNRHRRRRMLARSDRQPRRRHPATRGLPAARPRWLSPTALSD